MARSGRFGRLPRTAPDISSAIIALAREFIAAEERNYVDAWNNGGEVDGVRVTDDVLLAFFRKRRDGLSPKDPDWDKYNNVLGQYEFAIENSKMELKYAEGKVTDAGMAKFYREQAAKYPVDSEIYRRLRTLAAQYTERATRAASSGSRRAKNDGYDASVEKIKARKEYGYDWFWQAMEDLAKERGILFKENEDLMDLRVDEQDYRRFNQLLDDVLESPDYQEWRDNFEAYVRANGDPNFTLTMEYMTNSKKEGVTARLQLASNNGKRGDFTDATKELKEVGAIQGRLVLRNPLERYEDARALLARVIEDPNSDPLERWQATQDYISTLEEIYVEVGDEFARTNLDGSRTIKGRLENELTILYGGDVVGGTLWDDSSSSTTSDADAKSTKASLAALSGGLEALSTGAAVLMRGEDLNGGQQGWVFVPVESALMAEAISFAPVAGTSRKRGDDSPLSTNTGVPMMTIRQPDGSIRTVALANMQYATIGQPVVARAVVRDPLTGRPVAGVDPAKNQRLDAAYRFTMPDGTVLWQYWDSAGVRRWSNQPPFAEGLAATETPNGWIVDLPANTTMGWNVSTVFDPMYYNDAENSALGLTVFQSSAIAWMMSSDPNIDEGTRRVGIANARGLEAAILAEFNGDALSAQSALAEASNIRGAYLQNTPEAQIALMLAFQRGIVPALPGPERAPSVYDKDGKLVQIGERLPVQGLREAGGEGALMRQYINMFRTGQNVPGFNEDSAFVPKAGQGHGREGHPSWVGIRRGLGIASAAGTTPWGMDKAAAAFNSALYGKLTNYAGGTIVDPLANLGKGNDSGPSGGPIVNPNTGFVQQPPTGAPPPPNTYPYQPQPIAPPPPGSPGPPNIPGEEFDPDFNPPVTPPPPPPPPSGGRPPSAPIPV